MNKIYSYGQLKTKKILWLLLIYIAFLFGNSFFKAQNGDGYYYWSWGQHLAFGYLDGPPLIAYVMKFIDYIFGTTLFSVNVPAVFFVLCIAVYVYKITRFLTNNVDMGIVATTLWLISDATTYGLVSKTTYDGLEQLFWSMAIYYILVFLKTNHTRYIYYVGTILGLLLLSKYTGFVLILALFLFFISKSSLRTLFKNKHFYFSMFLMSCIFLPNIIWNYQHGWLTFSFQLHRHPSNESSSLSAIYYLKHFFRGYGIFLGILVFMIARHGKPGINKLLLYFFTFVSIVPLLFWTMTSFLAHVDYNYLEFLNIFFVALLAYYLMSFRYKKILWLLLFLYTTFSINFLTKFDRYTNHRKYDYKLLAEAVKIYDKKNSIPIIGESNYEDLSKLSFQSEKSVVTYSPKCPGNQGQFTYWNIDFQKKLIERNVQKCLYISHENTPNCVTPFFKECIAMPVVNTVHERNNDSLFVYQCKN